MISLEISYTHIKLIKIYNNYFVVNPKRLVHRFI